MTLTISFPSHSHPYKPNNPQFSTSNFIDAAKSSNVFTFLRWSFWYIWWGVLTWFYVNLRNFNPRNFQFFVGFSFKTIFAPSPTTMKFISKDVEFSCASFDICLKFVAYCPRTETPTQKFKNGFTIFTPQAISPSLVSF